MSNNNNPPFHVGQRVVCVKPAGKLVKGKIYTVLHVEKCKCGQWWIGCIQTSQVFKDDVYPCCGRISDTSTYRLARPFRFAPIEPRHQDVEIAEEIKELAEQFVTGTPEISDKPKKEPEVAK